MDRLDGSTGSGGAAVPPHGSTEPSRDDPRQPPRPAPAAPVGPSRTCRIVFEGFTASEPARVEVRAWLERLGALTAAMTDGEVTMEALDRGHAERHYRVRMELAMPAGRLKIGPEHPSNRPHEDIYVAIRNAFRAAKRELEAREQVGRTP